MKTLVHTEASMGWGGQEMRIFKEALAFKAKGWRVIIVAQSGSELLKRARNKGLETHSVAFTWRAIFSSIKALRALFKYVDLVITHSSKDAWIAGIAAKLEGKPVVRTRHLSAPIKAGLNSKILYNKLADYVITTCQEVVGVIEKQAQLSPGRCLSVPTGLDPTSICIHSDDRKNFRAKWGIAEDDFVIGTLCVLRSWKGLEAFLDAANQLDGVPKLKWLIVGGGPGLEHYKELWKQKSGSNSVIFTDHQEQPFAALAAMDSFSLLSTKNEGVSQSSLQAAFLKKPLITTATGGLKELCINQQSGFLVPKFNSQAVAKAALELKADPELAAKMGQHAHDLVMDRFTWKHSLNLLDDCYKKALLLVASQDT